MRIGGGFCALLLIGFLALLWRRERHPKPTSTPGAATESDRGDAPIVPMENHT
jgi:hypothetical protein